jgi:hypothetical protein
MKRLLIIGCVFLAVFFAFTSVSLAELFSWGVMGGPNFSSLYGDDKGDAGYRIGFKAGAFATIAPLKGIKFQPEAYISLIGAKFELPGDDLKYNLYYLDVPLLVKWYPSIVPLNFNVLAGPYIAFNLSSKAKQGSTSTDLDTKSVDAGITFGAGIEIFEKIPIELRYTLGLMNIVDGSELKNMYFTALGGYRFGSGKK